MQGRGGARVGKGKKGEMEGGSEGEEGKEREWRGRKGAGRGYWQYQS